MDVRRGSLTTPRLLTRLDVRSVRSVESLCPSRREENLLGDVSRRRRVRDVVPSGRSLFFLHGSPVSVPVDPVDRPGKGCLHYPSKAPDNKFPLFLTTPTESSCDRRKTSHLCKTKEVSTSKFDLCLTLRSCQWWVKVINITLK